MALSFKEVAEILKLIDASECDEVILELEGTRLVVRRNSSAGPPAARVEPRSSDVPVTDNAGSVSADAQTPASPAAPPSPAVEPGHTEMRAPMVGTFYRRPSPDEAPFVEVGAHVKAGDPVCLIEVMKLFTTIEAPVAGTIEAIQIEDATLVEFDQLLFLIRADGS